jgi:hypothetical protein
MYFFRMDASRASMSRAFARPGKLKPETQPAALPAWAKQQLFDSVVGLRLMALVLRTSVYSQQCNKWKVRDSAQGDFGASPQVCSADTIHFVESVKALRSHLSNPTRGAPIPNFSQVVNAASSHRVSCIWDTN